MLERQPVQMRDPLDGWRPVDLRTPSDLWRALERRHGALGTLFMRVQRGDLSWAFATDMLHRALEASGHLLTYDEVEQRVHKLGLFRVAKILMALFEDCMVGEPDPTEGDAREGEGEGVPLAGGA